MNQQAELYINNVDYSNDLTNYSKSYIQNYNVTTSYIKTRPFGVLLNWENIINAQSQRIKICPNSSFNYDDTWIYNINDNVTNSYTVYNLIPFKTYYYNIYAVNNETETLIKSEKFKTTGRLRMLKIDGTNENNYPTNFRDLGGWVCGNGKRIKYGRLIRGGEVYRENIFDISAAGKYEILNRFNISVELDFGDIYETTPFTPNELESLREHDTYGFYAYDDYREERSIAYHFGRTLVHNCLDAVIDRLSKGKNIYFHCNSGADRTGTFAMIIEALLGVSESDLSKDYELTTFFTTRLRNSNVSNPYGYKSMIQWIKSNYNGNTFNEKIYDLCTRTFENNGLNISPEQIESLRNIMIETDVSD